MKLTRRQLAAAISAASIVDAQQAARTATPADELEAARSRLKATAEVMAQQQVPMDTEPAFEFKA